MLLLLWQLACSIPASDPVAPVDEPRTQPEPLGTIGGEPILDRPVVLGGLDPARVDEAVASRREAIDDCWRHQQVAHGGRAGKVLVRFAVNAQGGVSEARTHSTSLRHAPTEDCLLEQVRTLALPPLERGEKALVTYTFAFPRD